MCDYSKTYSDFVAATASFKGPFKHRNMFFQNGVVSPPDGLTLALEELHHDPRDNERFKRSFEGFEELDDSDGHGHLVVYESSASGGECGIKERNKEKMRAPKRQAVLLKGQHL